MKLRARLVLTTIGLLVPIVIVLLWIDARARHRAAEEALARVVLMHVLEPGQRERCESDPASWGGVPLRPPGPDRGPPPEGERPGGAPPVLFAYGVDLESANLDAPRPSPALVDSLAERELGIDDALWPGSSVEVLLHTPWATGRCALILARGTTSAGWLGAILPASPIWLAPVPVLLLALLIAIGPVVERIRRLAESVKRSAAAGFVEPVVLDGRDEIAELSRAFDAAAREVRARLAENHRRERALREFLANTSHDVMIPLTVLAAHLTTLEEQVGEQRLDVAMLRAAMDEVQYIASLLQNLGLVAKLDAGEPELVRVRFELDALVGRVLARYRTIARTLEVSLDAGLPEPAIEVVADPTMLEQAVGNVVHNAIRYNRPGGHVAVLLERPSAGRFRLRVIDDGPGIPEDALERLVQRGTRGDEARTRDPAGQGLGLDITLRIARLHGYDATLARSEFGGLQVDLEGPEAT